MFLICSSTDKAETSAVKIKRKRRSQVIGQFFVFTRIKKLTPSHGCTMWIRTQKTNTNRRPSFKGSTVLTFKDLLNMLRVKSTAHGHSLLERKD